MKAITVNIKNEEMERLEEIAAETFRTKNDIVRLAVDALFCSEDVSCEYCGDEFDREGDAA